MPLPFTQEDFLVKIDSTVKSSLSFPIHYLVTHKNEPLRDSTLKYSKI